MDLKIVLPVIKSEDILNTTESQINSLDLGKVNYDIEFLEKGTSSIEGYYDETFNAPEVVKVIEDSEENFDAAIVHCFVGPGVKGAREKVDIPVIHPGETAIHLASLSSKYFSIIDILERTHFVIKNVVRDSGLEDNLVSVPNIGTPVLDLENNLDNTIEKAKEVSKEAVDNGAKALVLGCTGMIKVASKLEKALKNDGYDVPVIEPFKSSLLMSRLQTSMNLKNSEKAYPEPRKKNRELRQ